jgi:hypothetical protein
MMRWVKHVALAREIKIAYKICVGKLKLKKSLGKHRYSWKDNIKMNVECENGIVLSWLRIWHVVILRTWL